MATARAGRRLPPHADDRDPWAPIRRAFFDPHVCEMVGVEHFAEAFRLRGGPAVTRVPLRAVDDARLDSDEATARPQDAADFVEALIHVLPVMHRRERPDD